MARKPAPIPHPARLAWRATACLAGALLAGAGAAVPAAAEYELAATWGGEGANGEHVLVGSTPLDFPSKEASRLPAGIAVDRNSGYVYVADGSTALGNPRVVGLDPEGNFATELKPQEDADRFQPRGVATDASGNVYVADDWWKAFDRLARVLKFTASAAFDGSWNPTETDGTHFGPEGVAVDAAGESVYVTSLGWTVTRYDRSADEKTYIPAATWTIGEKAVSYGAALDPSETVLYFTEPLRDRMRKLTFTTDGADATEEAFGGSFAGPIGVAVDAEGYVYVAEQDADQIQKLTPAGAPVEQWSIGDPADDGGNQWPAGVAVDSGGNAYVTVVDLSADGKEDYSRVEKWAPVIPPCDSCNGEQQTESGGDTGSAGDAPAPAPDQPASDQGGTSGAAGSVQIAFGATSPGLMLGKTKSLSKRTLVHYLQKGFRGYAEPASAIKAIKASLVRKRGGRCLRLDKPTSKTSCTRTSSRGLGTGTDGSKLRFVYRPLASGSDLRHSAAAKRLLKRMRRGEVLRRGSYVLTFKVGTASGGSETFAYKLKVS